MPDVNRLSERIIGLAIEVHRHLGPGLSELAYEQAMCIELRASGIPHRRQVHIPVLYKGEVVAEHRPDLIVHEQVLVEVKSVERLAPIHVAQVLTYLRLTRLELGLLLNFNEPALRQGIKRVVLQPGIKTL